METLFTNPDDAAPLLRNRVFIALHILFCSRCASEFQRLKTARDLLKTGCIPPSPDFTDAVMAVILGEEAPEQEKAAFLELPGGVSTRGWVIAGLVILVSLATAFFGSDFITIVSVYGSSFLFPLGVIIGVIVTAYGSLFIGSHIEELSARFHLR
jgi:hypothetical protein